MRVRNTKDEKTYFYTREEFLNLFSYELMRAEQRWEEESDEGQAYLAKVLADEDGKYDDELSPFYKSLKKNFNKYGEMWPSPIGNIQIWKIL